MDLILLGLLKKLINNTPLDTTKTDANKCFAPKGSVMKVYRVGSNVTNAPLRQAGIIESFVYRDSGNVRVTQRYTVNYNTEGNPSYVRTGIGDENSITWTNWSK